MSRALLSRVFLSKLAADIWLIAVFFIVCSIVGIMGFARVMPGDSFEVSIRHGNQKWKSKGHVARDSEQKWEQEKRALGIQINSSLTVKVPSSRSRISSSNLILD